MPAWSTGDRSSLADDDLAVQRVDVQGRPKEGRTTTFVARWSALWNRAIAPWQVYPPTLCSHVFTQAAPINWLQCLELPGAKADGVNTVN